MAWRVRSSTWREWLLAGLLLAVCTAQPGFAQECSARQGNGLYCGMGGDPNVLYSVYNGDISYVQTCVNGCQVLPARRGVRQDECKGSGRPSVIVQAGHQNTANNCRDTLREAKGATNEAGWTPGIAACVVDALNDDGYDARAVDANFNCDRAVARHYDAAVSIHYRGHGGLVGIAQRGFFIEPVDEKFDAASGESLKLVDKLLDEYRKGSGVDQAPPGTGTQVGDEVKSYYMKNDNLVDFPDRCGFTLSQTTPFALVEAGVGDPAGADYDRLHSEEGKEAICESIANGIRQYLDNRFGGAPSIESRNVLLRPSHSGPPRIMLVGDSITHGTTGDVTWRYRLHEHLRAKGAAFDFVGPYHGPTDPNFADGYRHVGYYAAEASWNWDDAHDATWGRLLKDEVEAIQGLVREHQPDLLIVALGTNDLNTGFWGATGAEAANGMATLIHNARGANPQLDFLIVQIADTAVLDHQGNRVQEYFAALSEVARNENRKSSRIELADLYHSFDPYTDNYDGTHPNIRGEYIIAKVVADSLWQKWSYGGPFGAVPVPPRPPKPHITSVSPAVTSRSGRFAVTYDRVENPGVWTEYKLEVHNHRAFGFELVWQSPKSTPDLRIEYDGPVLPRTGVYQLVVTAVDPFRQRSPSDPVELTVDDVAPPPPAPGNVRVVPEVIGRDGGFIASWARVVNPGIWTEYRLELHEHEAFGGALVWQSPQTPNLEVVYDGPRLERSGTYQVVVVARDPFGQEARSAKIPLHVNDQVPPPLPPENVRIWPGVMQLDGEFLVAWDRVPNPKIWTDYKVELRTHVNFGFQLIWESVFTPDLLVGFQDGPLPQSGVYHVVVVARDIYGQLRSSAPKELVVQDAPVGPPAPGNIRVFPNTVPQNAQFQIHWDRVVNPGIWTDYQVEIHEDYRYGGKLVWESAWTPNISLAYGSPPLPKKGVYNVVVVSRDIYGKETPSAPVLLTVMDPPPPPAAPTGVSVAQPAIGSGAGFSVTWNRVPNGNIWTDYRVQVRNHPSYGGAVIWQSGSPTTALQETYAGSPLGPGVYQVVVIATDVFGQSAASAPVELRVGP